MKQRVLLFFLLLLVALGVQAQELTVKSFSVAPGDLDARSSTTRRTDRNGTPCALVKVQLPLQGAVFDGVVGDVQFRAGTYWAYLPNGAYLLSISHPQFHRLDLNLRSLRPAEENFRGVEQLTTYDLVINVPQTGQKEERKQKLIINYTPVDAMVIIDSKPYSGTGKVEEELPLGEHNYMVVANGYVTAEGMIKLNGGPAFVQPITLAREEVQEQAPAPTVATQQVPTEGEGMTAEQMNSLGDDYLNGRNSKTQNYQEAVKWFRKAAEQGYANGQVNWGYMYENGYGVEKNYTEAVKWYQKAAEQGHARGQSNLGVMYRDGYGVEKNYTEAVKWFRKAAEQGNAGGQSNLGYMYLNSYGVAKNYTEAVKWFRKAAEQGHAAGQRNLGYMYENGYGVEKNLATAKSWYEKAAAQGDDFAKKRLEALK